MSEVIEENPVEKKASGVTEVAPDVLVGTVRFHPALNEHLGPLYEVVGESGEVLAPIEIVSTFRIGPGAKATQHFVRAVVGTTAYLGRSGLKPGVPIRLMTQAARSAKQSAEFKGRQKKSPAPKLPAPAPATPPLAENRLDVPLSEYLCWSTRRRVVELLEQVSPNAHKRYGEVKYRDTTNPGLEQRKRAYEFAFRALLDLCYHRPGAF